MEFLVPPWEHQLKAIDSAVKVDHFALFFEMGTGKTATTINILRQKFAVNGRLMRTLILAPLITVENWKREFQMHSKIPKNDVIILGGSKVKRMHDFLEHSLRPMVGPPAILGNKIFITNYEALVVMPELYEAFVSWEPEVLILDESHKCKDMKSKRTKAAIKLADLAKFKYLLTGTPILNSPMDIWAQYRILDGGETFSKRFFVFRDEYFYDKNARMPKDRYFPDWQIRPGAYDRLNEKIYKKAMRVTKEECLDLPEFVREVVEVDLLPEQRKHYEEMKNEFITFIQDKAVAAPLALTKALRLQQIASGYLPVSKDKNEKFKSTPRQLALKELLENLTPNHKVIVWAVFHENYEQIIQVCESLKIDYVEAHGEIANQKKFDNVDRFSNDPKCRVFIGHPGSCGIGINLTCSTYNISYSRSFSLADYLQAQSRSHRGGQTQKVTWLDIVAKNTIDEIILNKLAKKEEMGEKILSTLAQELKSPSHKG